MTTTIVFIATTMLYIQLAEVIFKETTGEFTIQVANKKKEITKLA